MEILQFAFFPGRYFEWSDIIANALGALVGMILIKKLFFKH
jgi:VanZ family protein